jgi:hypothetical protein
LKPSAARLKNMNQCKADAGGNDDARSSTALMESRQDPEKNGKQVAPKEDFFQHWPKRDLQNNVSFR